MEHVTINESAVKSKNVVLARLAIKEFFILDSNY